MNSHDLTREQAAAIGKIIGQHLLYLGKLRSRMEKGSYWIVFYKEIQYDLLSTV